MRHALSRPRPRLARVSVVAAFLAAVGVALAASPSLPTVAPDAPQIAAQDPGAPQDGLAPTPDEIRTARAVISRLVERHYSQRPLDDAFSSDLFDHYLDFLDPTHAYLLATDVTELERWRGRLDDALRAGDLGPAFAIFRLAEERRVDRLERRGGRGPGARAEARPDQRGGPPGRPLEDALVRGRGGPGRAVAQAPRRGRDRAQALGRDARARGRAARQALRLAPRARARRALRRRRRRVPRPWRRPSTRTPSTSRRARPRTSTSR